MKVAIVVQRYGETVVGGAEFLARLLASRLTRDLDWEVEVYSSTARDYSDWRPFFAPGYEKIDSVLVHRFHVSQIRNILIFKIYNGLFAPIFEFLGRRRRSSRPGFLERLWYRLQGPYCPELINSLQRNQNGYDAVILVSYLYYPTVWGAASFRGKKILVPTLHDEAPAYFRTTRALMKMVDHIAVNSEEELALLRRLYPLEAQKAQIVAIGMDPADYETSQEIPVSDLPDVYALYLGRISTGKQVDKLLRYFEAFKRDQVDNDIHLVIAGRLDPGMRIPDAPFFHYAGFVSEPEKNYLIRRSVCVINSSPLESLSLITLEALAMGVPILVNELSETLRYYMKWAPTVFGYKNEATFIQRLHEITSVDWKQDPLRVAQLGQSKAWVFDAFSWSRVTGFFKRFVQDKETSDAASNSHPR